MRRVVGLPLFVTGWLVAGCAVGPRPQTPMPELPATWHESATGGLAPGAASLRDWWNVFGDEELCSLVRRAAEGNRDLRRAVLRVREARALRGVAAGELLPSLSGSAAYERGQASSNGLLGAAPALPGKGPQFVDTVTGGVVTGAVSQGISTAVPGAAAVATPLASGLVGLLPGRTALADSPETDLFATGFDASWEIDVFGGIRRNVEAADAELAATIEDYRGVLVSLLAEVATTYIDLRALQSQLAATRQNVELQRQTLALTTSRFEADLTSELDVRQAETNLATTESELPLLETGRTLAIYRLGVLLGLEPAALYDELARVRDIPQPPGETLVGVPADLLRRRPDLRAAERRLAAQTSLIGVATAELYPRFTLSGTLGFEATDVNHLLDGRSVSYGFGPAVRWNLFDGLRNINRIAAQEAVAHQAYVAYEQALLVALQDVESAMAAYKLEQVRRDALLRAVDAAREAVRIAETRYEDGLTDFQDVLVAQRSLVNLENAVAQSRGQVAVNLVALYKALGGGWSPDQTPQAEYLRDDTGVLADPVGFFFSGGKVAYPWQMDADGTVSGPPAADESE